MGKSMRTKCGLDAKSDKLCFEINTENVEAFLRRKIEIINSGLKQSGMDKNPMNPDKIKVRGIQIGKNFAPMLLMLPDGAVNKREYDESLPYIFRNDDEHSAVPIKKYYKDCLVKWFFHKDDINIVRSRAVQHDLGIVRQDDVSQFIYYTLPRIKTVTNNNGVQVSNLYVLLNPDTLFHDMLIDVDNPGSRFNTKITGFLIMDDNVVKYQVEREIVRRKKDKWSKEMDIVLSKMASS